MAVDGLHFVMSRTALLDLVLMFFVLAAFGCLLVDRDRARARLAAALPVDADGLAGPDVARRRTTAARAAALADRGRRAAGPGLRHQVERPVRPGRVRRADSAVGRRRPPHRGRPPALPGGAAPRRAAGPSCRRCRWRSSRTSGLLDRLVPAGRHRQRRHSGYFRDWAATDEPGGGGPGPGPRPALPLRSLWHYETEVYEFHVEPGLPPHLPVQPVELAGPGPARSRTSTSRQSPARTAARRTPRTSAPARCCASAPRCCGGRPASRCCTCCSAGPAPRLARRRDPVRGGGRLPAVVPVPGAHDLLLLRGRLRAVPVSGGGDDDRRHAAGPTGASGSERCRPDIGRGRGAGALVLLIIWNFIYFWPIYTGQTIPMDAWRARMWLDTWI